MWGWCPRLRGNPHVGPVDVKTARSIPASAGKPAGGGMVGTVHQVYPRVCGETFTRLVCWNAFYGLSPRLRGNPSPHASRTAAPRRSIPASAGKPLMFQSRPMRVAGLSPRLRGNRTACYPVYVYPRVCGETPGLTRWHPRRGSIPASAGKPETTRIEGGPYENCLGAQRSIPASAGKPTFDLRQVGSSEDLKSKG